MYCICEHDSNTSSSSSISVQLNRPKQAKPSKKKDRRSAHTSDFTNIQLDVVQILVQFAKQCVCVCACVEGGGGVLFLVLASAAYSKMCVCAHHNKFVTLTARHTYTHARAQAQAHVFKPRSADYETSKDTTAGSPCAHTDTLFHIQNSSPTQSRMTIYYVCTEYDQASVEASTQSTMKWQFHVYGELCDALAPAHSNCVRVCATAERRVANSGRARIRCSS